MKVEHKAIGFISQETGQIVEAGHQRHKVGECAWCDKMRAWQIRREFIRRMELCG